MCQAGETVASSEETGHKRRVTEVTEEKKERQEDEKCVSPELDTRDLIITIWGTI